MGCLSARNFYASFMAEILASMSEQIWLLPEQCTTKKAYGTIFRNCTMLYNSHICFGNLGYLDLFEHLTADLDPQSVSTNTQRRWLQVVLGFSIIRLFVKMWYAPFISLFALFLFFLELCQDYPPFFYPKLASLCKTLFPKMETVYYIHNFKGRSGGALFRFVSRSIHNCPKL